MPPLWESRFMLLTARRTGSGEYTSRLSLVGVPASRCRRLAERTAAIKPCHRSTSYFPPSLAARNALPQPSHYGLAVSERQPNATAAPPQLAPPPSTTL